MLGDGPWYLWLIVLGLPLAIPFIFLWESYHPSSEATGRYAQVWHRWHRLAVISGVFSPIVLTILFSLMLGFSDREAQEQQRQALETIKIAQEQTAVLAGQVKVLTDDYAHHQRILEIFERWEAWDRLRTGRWDEEQDRRQKVWLERYLDEQEKKRR